VDPGSLIMDKLFLAEYSSPSTSDDTFMGAEKVQTQPDPLHGWLLWNPNCVGLCLENIGYGV